MVQEVDSSNLLPVPIYSLKTLYNIMKTRVIKYDKSGNKVVNAFLELEPVAENVFKAFYQPADYGGPSQRPVYDRVPYQ